MAETQDGYKSRSRAMAMVNQIDLRTYYYYILLSPTRPPSSSLHNGAKILNTPSVTKISSLKNAKYENGNSTLKDIGPIVLSESLKVRKNQNDVFKPMFLPKNE